MFGRIFSDIVLTSHFCSCIGLFVGLSGRFVLCRVSGQVSVHGLGGRVWTGQMKLFNTSTNNIDIVRNCRKEFALELPSVILARHSEHFPIKLLLFFLYCLPSSVN